MCCNAIQGGWQNRILARLANEMSRYNPIHYVPKIKAPVLLVATTKDALCPIAIARRAAELNSNVQLLERDVGTLLQSCIRSLSFVPALCRSLLFCCQLLALSSWAAVVMLSYSWWRAA